MVLVYRKESGGGRTVTRVCSYERGEKDGEGYLPPKGVDGVGDHREVSGVRDVDLVLKGFCV